MKICLIGNLESVHIQKWVNYYLDLGHEVHIITDFPDEKIKNENLKVHQIKKLQSRNLVIFYINMLINVVYINYLIKKINPSIFHAHFVLFYGLYGVLTPFYPMIITVWGSDILRLPKESIMAKHMVNYALKKADKVVTTSEFMKTYLVNEFQLMKEKVVRIPWGINIDIFDKRYTKNEQELKESLQIKDNEIVVISNRVIFPIYNIDKIIESIPHVLKSNPNTIFLFIKGYVTSDFEDEMKLKAKTLGITKNIRFISKNLTSKEMANYLNISDIFISIPKTDQFGSSVIEGMACGLIPIVSNIEVYYQYLSNSNALFVDPDNPVDIAEKINYCIENPEIKEEFYKINRKIIEENENWDINGQKIIDLYEELALGKLK